MEKTSPTFPQRAALVLLGLLTAACILEAALRLCGAWIDGAQTRRILHGADAAGPAYTILCLGDSNTYGLGAPPGMDWPSQLEGLCRRHGYRVRVINAGILSANTHVGWLFLKEHLAALRPDMVLILIHANNWWYLYGFNQYQYGGSLGSRISDGLQHIRLFKLMNLLGFQLRGLSFDRREAGREENRGRPPDAAPAKPPLADKANPDAPPAEQATIQSRQRGEALIAERRYAEALPLFQALVEENPSDNSIASLNTCFVQTGRLLLSYQYWDSIFKRYPHINWNAYAFIAAQAFGHEDFDAYAEFAVRSVRNNPDKEDYYHVLFINGQWDFKGFSQQRILNTLRDLAPRYAPAREALQTLEALHRNGDTAVEDWTTAQLRDMVRLCRRYGCRVILQDYPRNSHKSVRKISLLENVPLVDHYRRFQQIPRDQWPSYFAPDEHPNERGYAVMAEEVFRVIRPDLPKPAAAPAPGR